MYGVKEAATPSLSSRPICLGPGLSLQAHFPPPIPNQLSDASLDCAELQQSGIIVHVMLEKHSGCVRFVNHPVEEARGAPNRQSSTGRLPHALQEHPPRLPFNQFGLSATLEALSSHGYQLIVYFQASAVQGRRLSGPSVYSRGARGSTIEALMQYC